MALFEENGPFQINPDLTLRLNPYTWSNSSNLVFVDQPLGTGYSTAPKTEYRDFSLAKVKNHGMFIMKTRWLKILIFFWTDF